MFKRLIFLVVILTALSAELAVANGRYFNGSCVIETGRVEVCDIEVSLPDWMGWLPDEVDDGAGGLRLLNLSELSIPGTHDTMADNGGSFTETQILSLADQLNAGIRALDIRARRAGTVFAIHHGAVFLNYFFGDDVLGVVADFLDEHPTETVLMRVKEEHTAQDGSDPFINIFRWYEGLYASYIWQPVNCNQIPDLAEVRGKIVILQDQGFGNHCEGPKWSILSKQDNYQPGSFGAKWDFILEHLNNADADTSQEMYVNFTSAVRGFPPITPWEFAGGTLLRTGMNERTLDELFLNGQSNKTGLVMMDFPGAGLIAAIVAHNFKYGMASEYAADWRAVVENIVHSADSDRDEETTRVRGQEVVDFLWRVTPDRYVSVAAAKTDTWDMELPWSSPVPTDELWGIGLDVEGVDYKAFGTTQTQSEVDTNQPEFINWMQGVVDAFSEDHDESFRSAALADEIRARYPNQLWAVIVKGDDGGFENWAFWLAGGSSQRIDQDGYRHVVWGVGRNDPPVADAGGPYTVNEGSTVELSGAGSTDPDGNQLTYRWDLDNDGNWDTSSASPTTTFTGVDDGPMTVRLQVSDGEFTSTAETTVTVANVAPAVTASGMQILENGEATVSGTIDDPGSLDTFTVTIDWGDGSPAYTDFYSAGTTEFDASHQYLDDGISGTPSDDYTIMVTVTDDDTGTGSADTTVTVDDVAPVVAAATYQDETGAVIGIDVPFALIGLRVDVETTFTDIGSLDTHIASVDWGDTTIESATLVQGVSNGTVTASHVWSEVLDAIVLITVTDDDTLAATDTATIPALDPVSALGVLADQVTDLLADPAPDEGVVQLLTQLLGKIDGNGNGQAANGALDLLAKGNAVAGVVKLQHAVETIADLLATGALTPTQTTLLEQLATSLVLTAKATYVDLVQIAEAAGPKRNDQRKIDDANDLAASADVALASGDAVTAIATWKEAVRLIAPLV